MIDTGFGGAEPGRRVAPRQHILLDAECRHVKAVNHVLRCHDHLDIATDGDVELIDFALTLDMFELPHPLLSNDVDFSCVPRWSPLPEENERAPREDDHEDSQRNH